MLSPVWDWAGKQRKSEKNIGVKAYLIQTQLVELCRDVAYWNTEKVDFSSLEQACYVHYRLASIHPFEDGNGRFSRLTDILKLMDVFILFGLIISIKIAMLVIGISNHFVKQIKEILNRY